MSQSKDGCMQRPFFIETLAFCRWRDMVIMVPGVIILTTEFQLHSAMCTLFFYYHSTCTESEPRTKANPNFPALAIGCFQN